MNGISFARRNFLRFAAMAGLMPTVAQARAGREASLTEALQARRSTRAFRPAPIADDVLLALAWAGCGINRPQSGLRTAPSWHGATETQLYLADARGIRFYDPARHAFAPVGTGDVRARLSPQRFVATAPVVALYSANLAQMPKASEAERRHFAAVDAAIVAQNVYLFCASQGLGTCLVGGIDTLSCHDALKLTADSIVTFIQPIGRPAQGGG